MKWFSVSRLSSLEKEIRDLRLQNQALRESCAVEKGRTSQAVECWKVDRIEANRWRDSYRVLYENVRMIAEQPKRFGIASLSSHEVEEDDYNNRRVEIVADEYISRRQCICDSYPTWR